MRVRKSECEVCEAGEGPARFRAFASCVARWPEASMCGVCAWAIGVDVDALGADPMSDVRALRALRAAVRDAVRAMRANEVWNPTMKESV